MRIAVLSSPTLARTTAGLALWTLAACGDHPWPGAWANGAPFAECIPLTGPDPCGPTTGRTFALASCGSLNADNTLTVIGQHAGVALWVRDQTVTHAPLYVDGDFSTATNTATNSQQIRGRIITNASPPACPDRLPDPPQHSWDVRITEPASVVLEGCSYAQPSLQVDNTLDVRIRGDLHWIIQGDLHIAAPLRIALDPGAQLTWHITGALRVDNTLTVQGPTSLRVDGPIHIAAPTTLDGSLIAPSSRLDVDNTLTIEGAAYVGDLHVAAPMNIGGSASLDEAGCLR